MAPHPYARAWDSFAVANRPSTPQGGGILEHSPPPRGGCDPLSKPRKPVEPASTRKDDFKSVGRRLQCNESEERLNRALREIAKHGPEHQHRNKGS